MIPAWVHWQKGASSAAVIKIVVSDTLRYDNDADSFPMSFAYEGVPLTTEGLYVTAEGLYVTYQERCGLHVAIKVLVRYYTLEIPC